MPLKASEIAMCRAKNSLSGVGESKAPLTASSQDRNRTAGNWGGKIV